jgi:gamma-butyrobetaine dioxygenase
VLHCLRRADHGGETVLVDGLMAAGIVRQHHPVYFDLLTRFAVTFERREPRFHMRASRPLVEGDHRHAVRALHYDPLHTAPLDLPPDEMRDFYSAYCCLARTLNRLDPRLRMRLDSGDLLVLDNRRVLFGSSAFQGERVIESCYAEWDGLAGRCRALQVAPA